MAIVICPILFVKLLNFYLHLLILFTSFIFQVEDLLLDPLPTDDITLSKGHVIMRVNTRDMLNVPEEELLDVLNGQVNTT